MRQATEGRLAKLEDSNRGGTHFVIGSDGDDCREQLRVLLQAGDVSDESKVVMIITGVPRAAVDA